jgi:hypothetical protein
MSVNNWRNPRPKKFYKKAVEMFGKPNFVANVPRGMAVPAPHHDYFYSSIRCFVPPNKRLDVLSISGSINYDGLTKLLTARCASIEANIATLYLGMCVANGVKSIKEVKKEGLYGKYIRGEMESHVELKKHMMKMKKKNNKKYAKQIKAPFDPLAFPKC